LKRIVRYHSSDKHNNIPEDPNPQKKTLRNSNPVYFTFFINHATGYTMRWWILTVDIQIHFQHNPLGLYGG